MPRAANRVGLKRAGFGAGGAAQYRARDPYAARPRAHDRRGSSRRSSSECSPSPQIAHLVEFLTSSERGIARPVKQAARGGRSASATSAGSTRRNTARSTASTSSAFAIATRRPAAPLAESLADALSSPTTASSSVCRCGHDSREYFGTFRARPILPRARGARSHREADDAHEPRGCRVLTRPGRAPQPKAPSRARGAFQPRTVSAREGLTAVRFIECHRLAPFKGRGADVNVMLDLMIHDLDVILSLVGARPVSVSAVGIPVLTDDFDIANARIEFANSAIANVTASRASTSAQRDVPRMQPNQYVVDRFRRRGGAASHADAEIRKRRRRRALRGKLEPREGRRAARRDAARSSHAIVRGYARAKSRAPTGSLRSSSPS